MSNSKTELFQDLNVPKELRQPKQGSVANTKVRMILDTFNGRLLELSFRPIVIPLRLVFSGTFMYPLLGVTYFISHPVLWSYLFSLILPQLIMTFIVYVIVFIAIYPLQAVFSFFFNGPIGLITAIFAVLQIGALISNWMVTWLILPVPLNMMFDAILTNEGLDEIVLRGKLRRIVRPSFPVRVRKAIWTVPIQILFPIWLYRSLLIVGLNFIPVIGPILVVIIQAPSKGYKSHQRYFDLKGLDTRQINAVIRSKKGEYLGFGLVAGLLETIPFLSMFFIFSNMTGASLWAVSLENRIAKEQYIGNTRALGKARGRALINAID
ncbi:hypothetical protein PP7435_CHR1-1298 [Komagataella phaffii CBS 7435]|uniref:Uncharacterized protein n=2 Tax=Komagataella phaffii TaxID=460519 RepID=C4QYM4_KOMPG|nr:Hypothetical protein PAS_chr1-4_0495 [Komagataella phaffii GS115]AOA60815.1 GQ67_01655T0 [Komagataella phaffii]CAH2447173.1 hypothetical protein BQ9382_C1-6785 [Komagataella phaffii CBS 7435]AOA66749.1 GQ68_01671T0 [Komagataella phaffii GS115]CAY68348.1 Hypothetical protein PAS_chr1-4_0495 [Komagataella phaffii GS115]SCV11918.1 hypothetical protein PP7435_CHR1-1298 [Komagataella phaffii CBS 7435]